MQEKFQNGVPLYRQKAYWKGQGVELQRNTMANWVIHSSRQFTPLYELLRKELLRQDIVNVDETRVHVLKEDGRESKPDVPDVCVLFCRKENRTVPVQS